MFTLALVGLLGVLALATADGGDGEEGDKALRTSCVDPSEIEVLTEGMRLVYANQDDEAADWFRGKCWNGTVGQFADMCTCFYWAFRAHTVSASCCHAPAVHTRETAPPERAAPLLPPQVVNDTEAAEVALDAALEIAVSCAPACFACPVLRDDVR
jgi:hypothetical protein